MNIKTVTVIGANGTMGCGIAGIIASFGDAKVYMICRRQDSACQARQRAALSVRAEAVAKNLIPKTYEDLAECIRDSDLVIESVAEDIVIKKAVYTEIAPYLKPDTIIATGTSGLSIEELSKAFHEELRENFLGIHFFNPPYHMILCEVIPSRYTNRRIVDGIKEYLDTVLYRKVVEVKDHPAFLGNRVGFQFINEAMQCAKAHEDKGGIDYIDAILGPFTGRSMAPLVTSDYVGLDIHQAIVDNVYHNTEDYAHDTFRLPDYVIQLISEHRLGRKSGSGLYQTIVNPDGTKSYQVYEILSGEYRPVKRYVFPFALQMRKYFKRGNYSAAFRELIENQSPEASICLQFLMKYAIYGIITAKTVGESIHSADDVMAAGFHWVPPLAVMDALGGPEAFLKLSYQRLPAAYLSRIRLEEVFEEVTSSRYDFRPFFSAK